MEAHRLSLRIYSHVEDAIRQEAAFTRAAATGFYKFEARYSPRWSCISPCVFVLNSTGMESIYIADEETQELWLCDSRVYDHDCRGIADGVKFKAYLIGKIHQPELGGWEVHVSVEVSGGN